jgi:hypothetical protein
MNEYVRRALRDLHTHLRVVVDVELAGDEIRAAFGRWVAVEDLGSNRSRITIDTDSFRWPTHILAELDAQFTVVEPRDFEVHLQRVGRRFSRVS